MEHYTNAWQSIVKPFRPPYSMRDLGPKLRIIGDELTVGRDDFEFVNSKRNTIFGSYYYPVVQGCSNQTPDKVDGCVIYLHSHSGSRLEGLTLINHLPQGVGLCLFDFSGSGHSEGDFLTLGDQESQDLLQLLDILKGKYFINRFCFWGRSMGAVTSLLFLKRYPGRKDVAGIILDSPYIDTKEMVEKTINRRLFRWLLKTQHYQNSSSEQL